MSQWMNEINTNLGQNEGMIGRNACREVLLAGLDDHVVHVYIQFFACFFIENLVHHSLACSFCICRSKGHHIVLVVGFLNHASYFLSI